MNLPDLKTLKQQAKITPEAVPNVAIALALTGVKLNSIHIQGRACNLIWVGTPTVFTTEHGQLRQESGHFRCEDTGTIFSMCEVDRAILWTFEMVELDDDLHNLIFD